MKPRLQIAGMLLLSVSLATFTIQLLLLEQAENDVVLRAMRAPLFMSTTRQKKKKEWTPPIIPYESKGYNAFDQGEPLSHIRCKDRYSYETKYNWMKRGPYFLIIGAQKAGTSSMAEYLYQHPKILRATRKETHFFDNNFDSYITKNEDAIYRDRALLAYSEHFKNISKSQDDSLVSFEATPKYLFWSANMTQRIMCVTPWVKVIAILRNPVDRAYSHYMMDYVKGDAVDLSGFEDMLWRDVDYMREVKLTRDWEEVDFDEYHGSREEDAAYHEYQRRGGPLGRGMYAVHLRHWLHAFEKHNKSKSDMLVLQFEKVFRNHDSIQDAVNQISTFLGLPHYKLHNKTVSHKGTYHKNMDHRTLSLLEKFYVPYNRALGEMLGPEWVDIWKPTMHPPDD